MAVELNFAKHDVTPWGFRLTGGSDYGVPLTVIKVYEESLAEKIGLKEGDQLYQLNGECMMQVTHEAAHEIITRAGNSFQLAILRGQTPQYAPHTDQLDPFAQNTLDTAPVTLKSTGDQPFCQRQAAQVSSTIEHRFSNNLTPKVYHPFSKRLPNDIPPLENPLILSPNHLDEFQTVKQQERLEISSNLSKQLVSETHTQRSQSSCSTSSQNRLGDVDMMAVNRLTPKGFRPFSKKLPNDIPVLENPLILSPNHLDEFQTIKQQEWKENSTKLMQESYNINQIQRGNQDSSLSQKKFVEEELIVTGKSLIDLNEIENSVKDVVEQNVTKTVVKDSKICHNKVVNVKKFNDSQQKTTEEEKKFDSSVEDESLNVKEIINKFSKTIEDSNESVAKSTKEVFNNRKSTCQVVEDNAISLEDAKSSAIHAAAALSHHAGNNSLKIPCSVANIQTHKQTDMLLKTFFVHLTDVMVALTQIIANDESPKCAQCGRSVRCDCTVTQNQSSSNNYTAKEMNSSSIQKTTESNSFNETSVKKTVKKPPDYEDIIVNGSAETGRIMKEVIRNTMGVDVTVEGKDPLEWLADLDGRKTPNYYISKVKCIQTGVVDNEVQEIVDDQALTKKIDEENCVVVESEAEEKVDQKSCAKIRVEQKMNEDFEVIKATSDVKKEEGICSKIDYKENIDEGLEKISQKVEVIDVCQELKVAQDEEEVVVTMKTVADNFEEKKHDVQISEVKSEKFESVSAKLEKSSIVENRFESEKHAKFSTLSAVASNATVSYNAISNQHQEMRQISESNFVEQESSFSAMKNSAYTNIQKEFSDSKIALEETRVPVEETVTKKDVTPLEDEEIVEQAVFTKEHGKEPKPKDPQTPNTDEYVFRLDVKLGGNFSKPDNTKREYVKQPSLHEDLSIVRRPGLVLGDVKIENSSTKQSGGCKGNQIIKDPLKFDNKVVDINQIKGSLIEENIDENGLSDHKAAAILDSSSETVDICKEYNVVIPKPAAILNAVVENGGQEESVTSATSCKLSMTSNASDIENVNSSKQQSILYTENEDILNKIIEESNTVSSQKGVLSMSAEIEQNINETVDVCSTVKSDTTSASVIVENEQKLSENVEIFSTSSETCNVLESEKSLTEIEQKIVKDVEQTSIKTLENSAVSENVEIESKSKVFESEKSLEVSSISAEIEQKVINDVEQTSIKTVENSVASENVETSQNSATNCSAMKNLSVDENVEYSDAIKKKVSFSLSSDKNTGSNNAVSIQTAKSVEGLKKEISHSNLEEHSSVGANPIGDGPVPLNVSTQESQVTSAQFNNPKMASTIQHDGNSLGFPPPDMHVKVQTETPELYGFSDGSGHVQSNGYLETVDNVESQDSLKETVNIEETSTVMTMGAAQKAFATVAASKVTTVNGNSANVTDAEKESDLGKAGITDEEIAEIISGEAEVLKEQHVLGVDFGKMMPTCEYLKRSEVFKLLNDEAIKTAAEKMQEMRKYTKFLQRPDRPVPFCKRFVDQLASEEPPYRVNIKKQPKKEQDTLGHSILTEGVFLIPEVPILVPEPSPQYFEAPEYLADSSFPDLEDTGITIPELKEEQGFQEVETTEEEKGPGNEREEEEEEPAENHHQKAAEDPKDWDDSTLIDEEIDADLPVSEQLLRVQKQLTALSKLPAAIQLTLDLVNKQLGKMMPGSAADTKLAKEEAKQNGNDAAENGGETQQDGGADGVENGGLSENGQETNVPADSAEGHSEAQLQDEEHVQEPVLEEQEQELDVKSNVTAETMEQFTKIQEQDKSIEKIKKDLVAELSKDQAIRKRGPRPAFGPLAPQPRAMVLPGGRRWRKPKDAYDDAFIAETLSAQASIITGTTLGKFESDHLQYDDRESNCHLVVGNESMRVNFMKYEKPPIGLDHLKNSSVFKLVHEMDTPLHGIEDRKGGILLAESEFRERCRSATPSSLIQNGNGVAIIMDS